MHVSRPSRVIGRRLFTRYSLAKRKAKEKPEEQRARIDIKQVLSVLEKTDDKKEVTIPVKSKIEHSLEKKENYRTPFVSFDLADCLEVAVSGKNQPLFTKYANHVDIKDSGDFDRSSKNLLDLLLEYPQKRYVPLEMIARAKPPSAVYLPDDVRNQAMTRLTEVSEVEEMGDLINGLLADLPRYTKAQLLRAILNESPAQHVAPTVTRYVCFYVVDFTESELHQIVSQLAVAGKTEQVSLIETSYNKINSPGRFIDTVPPDLQVLLVDSFVRAKNFQDAFRYLESLITGYKMTPEPEVLVRYISLVSSIANSIKSGFQDRKLVFNAYSWPVETAMRKKGALVPQLVEVITPWLTRNELFSFVKFLKLCPDYKTVIPQSASTIIKSLADRFKGSTRPDSDQAIMLTALVNQMGAPLNDDTKLLLAESYAKLHSPLAVKMWTDNLKLTDEKKSKIIELLKSKSSRFDQPLPGRSQADIDKVASELM